MNMQTNEDLDQTNSNIPLILTLDISGQPVRWMTWQDATTMVWNKKVIWSLGEPIKLRGGMNRHGDQNIFELPPIIACNDKSLIRKKGPPLLTNRSLFRRDHNMCMYCGHEYQPYKLTRDHIMPRSRGGKDTWNNVVASCKGCNNYKDNKTPEEAGLKLLCVPYVPNPAEILILQNRRIIADQMSFLSKQIPEHSSTWKYVNQVM